MGRLLGAHTTASTKRSRTRSNAFAARWSGTYVEDRLRNDWLLELGRRRDWANFAVEYPRFRMNDDREVTCYALLVDQLAGKDVREAALAAWLAQREADDGCALMAATLFDAKIFTPANAWRKARLPSSRPPTRGAPGGAAGQPRAANRAQRRDRQSGPLPVARSARPAVAATPS